MHGLNAANEIFLVQSVLHFIILRVAHSHRVPGLPTPSYTSLCEGLPFSAYITAYFYLYKVFIFTRLPALFLPAISFQVWNGLPSNLTTASGKRKGEKNHKVFHFNMTSEWIMGSFKLAFSHTPYDVDLTWLSSQQVFWQTGMWGLWAQSIGLAHCKCGWYALTMYKKRMWNIFKQEHKIYVKLQGI